MNTYEVTTKAEKTYSVEAINEEDAIVIVEKNLDKLSSRDRHSITARRLK